MERHFVKVSVSVLDHAGTCSQQAILDFRDEVQAVASTFQVEISEDNAAEVGSITSALWTYLTRDTSGAASPSAVARSIWCSCSWRRISRMSSAMAYSWSASHCATRSR
jgi:hypothetical protein